MSSETTSCVEEASARSFAATSSLAEVRGRQRTIVVAEDDLTFRCYIAESLRRAGYLVIEAADGNELRDLVKGSLLSRPGAKLFDAIVSDNRMRGATGLSVLRAFRLFDKTTPFLLMTAFRSDTTHSDAIARGANLMLSKPFELVDLLSALALHLPRGR